MSLQVLQALKLSFREWLSRDKEIAALEKRNEELDEEIIKVSTIYSQSFHELELLRRKNSELSYSLSKAETELSETKRGNESLARDVKALRAETLALYQQREILSKNLNVLFPQVKELTIDNAELQAAKDRLTQLVEMQQREIKRQERLLTRDATFTGIKKKPGRK